MHCIFKIVSDTLSYGLYAIYFKKSQIYYLEICTHLQNSYVSSFLFSLNKTKKLVNKDQIYWLEMHRLQHISLVSNNI